MRQGKSDPRLMGKLACLIASALPSVLSAQTAPHATTTVPLRSGQSSPALRPQVDPASGVSFRDVSAQAGLNTVPHSSSDRRYIVETMGGGGVALLDCDNDGRLDIRSEGTRLNSSHL